MNSENSNTRELQKQLLPRYQKWGLCIIPLRFKDKTPAVPWKKYQREKLDVGELFEWFGTDTPRNVGIVCGKVSNNLVVLDCDTEERWAEIIRYCDDHGIDLYQTPQVKTARGFHIWIRLRNLPPSRRIAGVDIQSEGKYVVAPPSIHPTGVQYNFLNPDVSEILEFDTLADLGIQEEPEISHLVAKPPHWVTEALTGVAEGERDATGTRLAGYFKGKDLPLDVTITILKDWTVRCQQPPNAREAFTPEATEKCVRSVYRYGEPIEELEEEAEFYSLPQLPEDVWQGLFPSYRTAVAHTTEAADVFHFGCFAQVIGCTLGRRLHVYHARRLYPNFNVALVGRSGVTRKDTAWSKGRPLLEHLHADVDPENPVFQIIPGIGSAEGLLDALAGERKVVLLNEAELLSLFAKARQEALSNLIPKLSSLYDCPDWETLQTRNKKVRCHEPFLSILSGTTLAWLQAAFTEQLIYGGFANRIAYLCGEPKEPMPFPKKVDPTEETNITTKLNDIRMWADELRQENNGELDVSEECKDRFAAYYWPYHKRCAIESLTATLIPRIQDFIWKFALLYAAMDFSSQIRLEHLEPAIAVGNYLEQSVTAVFRSFGSSRGKRSEDKLLTYLQSKGRNHPVPKRVVYRALKLSALELEQAANPLIRIGFIKASTGATKAGREIDCYEAL